MKYEGKRDCWTCFKKVAAYVPKGGDGSAVVIRKHENKKGETCNGSYKLIK